MHSFKGRESQQCGFLTRLLHADLKELQQAVRRAKHWLARMGLHLHADKTRFTHTLTPYQGQVGFDFLSFSIRQEPVENSTVMLSAAKQLPASRDRPFASLRVTIEEADRPFAARRVRGHSRLAPQEHSPRVKTIINPSREASKRHLAAIDQRLQKLQTASQARVIAELNPLIVGWAAYYNGVVEAEAMSRYDDLVEQRLINWASKRHPSKERDWLLGRYWHRAGNQRRIFATHDGVQLRAYRQTSILRG